MNINLTTEELALLEDIVKGYSWWFEDRVLSGTHIDEDNRLAKTQELASRLKMLQKNTDAICKGCGRKTPRPQNQCIALCSDYPERQS